MIYELLEKKDNLFEIASILYGEMFVSDEKFWGSPTDIQLQDVYEKLEFYGYIEVEPTDEMIEAAKILEEIVVKGRNSKNLK